MPQRQFWTKQIPTEFHVKYVIDPQFADKPASVSFLILDQAKKTMEIAGFMIPVNVIHECVSDCMSAAWECYLFGELGGIQRTLAPIVKAWRRESASRPLWG